MENEVQELCDDRKKLFDISHVHFTKTMSEISKLRANALLFDVVIKSDGISFQVSARSVRRLTLVM